MVPTTNYTTKQTQTETEISENGNRSTSSYYIIPSRKESNLFIDK
jgi:hypothetical protein